MDTLVISDMHLGRRFRKRKLKYLISLFKKYDKIIINGDFWDYYSFSFDNFLESKWNELFPILKKKAVYIFGNHDKKKWSDKRVSLFSKKQAYEYKLKIGEKTFVFRHGHNIFQFIQIEKNYFVKIVRFFRLNFIGLLLDILATYIPKDKTGKVRKFARELGKNEILFVGHGHKAEIKLNDKFIMGGYVLFGKSYYVVLNNKGFPRIKNERY